MKNLAIIGGGNIGQAIARGLMLNPNVDNNTIHITRRQPERLDAFKAEGIKTGSDNTEAVKNAEVIVLSVQPAQIQSVMEEIAPELDSDKHILCSVATAVGCEELESLSPAGLPVYLVMPNTAAAIGESMTCIATNTRNTKATDIVMETFQKIGRVMRIDDSLMASATVIAACGIAYAMRFIRAASQGGTEIGFHAEEALELAAQTAKGASQLLLSRGLHPEREIDKVTTPMGCTISGLNEMEHRGFSSALIKGIVTSRNKISNMKPVEQ